MTERALYIWHAEGPADLAPIRAAKVELAVDFTARPVAVSTLYPGPASARILAVGSRPPFLCDYALVSERTGPQGWKAAVAWALELIEDERSTTVLDTLRSIFGAGVRELDVQEVA